LLKNTFYFLKAPAQFFVPVHEKSMKKQKPTNPIDTKEEVQQTKDERIDQDFPGYPHPPSQENTIKPNTKEDKANARLIKKENYNDEQSSDGSANAFEESEQEILRGEMDDDNAKTY
jgi:hypothetical protein